MTVDWALSERELHRASVTAIGRFASNYPDVTVCCFFFDCDEPRYGRVGISLDTLENNIRSAKQQEEFAIEQRQKMLTGENAWQSAKYFLRTPVLKAFNTNSGDFTFPQYAEVQFPEWRKLAKEGGYPVGSAHQDDYLESSARLIIWRVAEHLVVEEAFKSLKLAAPFMVGYSIHDQEEVILRLLNWPGR
jgi:hypothetical protein